LKETKFRLPFLYLVDISFEKSNYSQILLKYLKRLLLSHLKLSQPSVKKLECEPVIITKTKKEKTFWCIHLYYAHDLQSIVFFSLSLHSLSMFTLPSCTCSFLSVLLSLSVHYLSFYCFLIIFHCLYLFFYLSAFFICLCLKL
jgi:hypothetical protein